MVFGAVGLPAKLTDKYAPADIGRFFNRRLPFAPLGYGETCACLFRYISHTQHLHSANRVVGCMDRLCGQIKAALWLLSERKCSQSEAELRLRVASAACEGELCRAACWHCPLQVKLAPRRAHRYTTSGGISVRTL